MKKLLLFVLLTSFSFGYGQNLSLSQLMSLRTMDLDDAEIYLTQRGWNYSNADAPSDGQFGIIEFVYGSSGDFNYAESFITKLYSYRGVNKLAVQINKQTKYLEYLSAVKGFKATLIYSGVEDNILVKVYQGATTTFKFSTRKVTNQMNEDKTSWLLTILSNEDYE